MSRMRVGLLLVAALALVMLVLPASAAFNVVPAAPNNAVFVGEQGLDITAPLGTTSSCTIAYFSGGRNPSVDAPDATINVPDPTNFYVSPSTFVGKTGVWYLYVSGVSNLTHSINVNMPRTEVYIRDGAGDDITGKSVTRGTPINFRVETNLYSIQQRDPAGTFPFKIKVESPSGVVYNALYISSSVSKDLINLPVNSDLWLWNGLAPVGMWDTSSKDGSGTNRYTSGTYKVSAECNANQIKDNYNVDGATKSTSKQITIASDTLSIVTNADQIVRGAQFTTSVTGTPNTAYKLFVESVGSDIAPKITPNQEGVLLIDAYTATITSSSSGTRSIGFYTDKDTKAKKWTIRVETMTADKYDTVSVTVKAGVVTLVASGDGAYYLGQEVILSGSNSETDVTYFFITGPNLPSGGGRLDAPTQGVVDGNPASFATATVLDDKTFEYKWNTASLAIDAGTYTIYAVSEPHNRDNLGDTQYATASVNLRKPFLSAAVTPSNVAAGDKAIIAGKAEGRPSPGVAIWIMGKNFVRYTTTSVDDDGTFSYELKGGDTQNMASGQYWVVVQHPMYNDKLDVYPKADGGYPYRYVVGPYPNIGVENVIFTLQGVGSLQGSDAAEALITAIDNSAVDDIGTQIQFLVAQPQITIKPIPQVTIGNTFKVEGLTNLAVGNQLIIETISSSFGPTSKNQAGQFSGFSGSTKVVDGTDQWNSFSMEIPSANFIKDEYIATVSSVEVAISGSTTFNVMPFVPTPTPTPTPVPTLIVTTVPTTVPTTTATPTPTPTASPGFGALIALVGLGCVAFLVVRKQ